MKSTRKVVRFDYSKFESEEHVSDHDVLEQYEFGASIQRAEDFILIPRDTRKFVNP